MSKGRSSQSIFLKRLKSLQFAFYLAFVFLWFKDNWPMFRGIPIGPAWAAVPLLVLTAARILIRIRRSGRFTTTPVKGRHGVLIGILLLALLVRAPFLAVPFGLVDSDDMIPILSAKHIIDGGRPSVYYYGEIYEGTLGHHLFALVFKVTGYSLTAALLVSVGFLLGFIAVMHGLFRRIFGSASLASALCLFYALPLGYLPALGFHLTYSPAVLFLGALALYLAWLILNENRTDLLPALGFSLGLGLWTHPLMAYFAVAVGFLAIMKLRFDLKSYAVLAGWGLAGLFPALLNQIGNRFETVRYLFSGSGATQSPAVRTGAILGKLTRLVSGEVHDLNRVYLGLILLGIAVIVAASLFRRRIRPELIFVLFFGVVLLVFALSRFDIDDLQVRYLYPFYVTLPVLMAAPFIPLRSKLRPWLVGGLFVALFLASNLKPALTSLERAREAHGQLRTLVSAVEATGKIHWGGDYWQSILLTGLSGERITGWSFPHEKYPPYRLEYFNAGENGNLLFFHVPGAFGLKFRHGYDHISGNLLRSLDQGRKIERLISRLGVSGEIQEVGDYGVLIHNVPGMVTPRLAAARIPEVLPDLELTEISASGEVLNLRFTNAAVSEFSGFRLTMDIPGYSAVTRGFSSDNPEIRLSLPFPRRSSFPVRFRLDFQGLPLGGTVQEVSCRVGPEELAAERPEVVELAGFGPLIDYGGEKWRVLEKEVRFEINPRNRSAGRLRIRLLSPFQFSHPHWYGEYSQQVEARLGDGPAVERLIAEGENWLALDLPDNRRNEETYLLSLRFRYHLPFDFAPLWQTSVLFGGLEIHEERAPHLE